MKKKMAKYTTILLLGIIFFSKQAGAQSDMFEWNQNTKLIQEITADHRKIDHMVTVRLGQDFSLSECCNITQVGSSFVSWSVVSDVSELSGGFSNVKDGIKIASNCVITQKTGFSILCATYQNGEQRAQSYLGVNVIPKGNGTNDYKYSKIYSYTKNLSGQTLTTKNVAARYQKFHELVKAIDSLKTYEKDSTIQNDGVTNYWNITNTAAYQKENERFQSFFKKHCTRLTKVKFLSEYEGIALKLKSKVSKIDLLSNAYEKHKSYTKKNKKISLTVLVMNSRKKVLFKKNITIKKGQREVSLSLNKRAKEPGSYYIQVQGITSKNKLVKYRYKELFKAKDCSIYAKRGVRVYKTIYAKKTIGYLYRGKRYHCLEKGSNGYIKVRYGKKTGYVLTKNVTFHPSRVVSKGDSKYSYQDMKGDILSLCTRYSDIMSASVLTQTVDGNNVYCIRLGNASARKKVVIQSTIHAREWLNTQLVMLMIEKTCADYYSAEYDEISYQKLLKNVCFYIVPMMNPDGVNISQYGLKGVKNAKLRKFVKKTAKGKYSRWKANARGVDLNRNYSIGFAKSSEKKKGSEGYAGKTPFSEKETRALRNLILRVHPKAVVNYHEVGNIIYYKESNELTNLIHRLTGYCMSNEGDEENGTLGDWLSARKIAWCTPETCMGTAPVSHLQLTREWVKHQKVLPALARLYY